MAEDFDSLLALLRRTTDEFGWLQPLLDNTDSAAVLGGVITVFGRLGPAVDHNGAQATISGSSGGQPGTSSLTITRAAGGTTGTLPAGYPFVDERGARAVLQVDVVVGGGTTTLVLPLQTERESELLNTEDDPLWAVALDAPWFPGSAGYLLAPALTIELVIHTPGPIGTMAFTWAINGGARSAPVLTSGVTFPFPIPGTGIIVTFGAGAYVQGNEWTVAPDGTVTQTVGSGPGSVTYTAGVSATTFQSLGPGTPIIGAAADFLSVHGAERGLQRQPNETESDYRQRIRNIPDAVSPIAIADTVQTAALRPGLPAFLTLEPFEDGATQALKDLHGLGSFTPYFLDDSFLDDPGVPDVLYDRRIATAYFEIRAQDYLRDGNGEVLFLDDGFADDPVLGYPDMNQGVPPAVLASLLAILFDVEAKRAGGVNYDLVLHADEQLIAVGTTASAAFVPVANFTPAPGTIFLLVGVLASHNADPTTGVDHFLEFDLEGGGMFSTATWSRDDSERVFPLPPERVTAIRGYLRSDGVVVANLVVSIKAVVMTL